jgi:GT2 family glycosyltransferase
VSVQILSAPVAVAIPVKDEAENIANCLHALATQTNSPRHEVVLLLNNCEDATAEAVSAVAPMLRMPLHVLHMVLPREQANAGHARRMAMQYAAKLVGPQGILLTTDADSRVAPDWIEKNLLVLQAGAEVVAGRGELDPIDATRIPARLHQEDERECIYAALLDEIDALVDLDPTDPWPRHSEHSGASIAVTVNAYHRAGGIPPVALGEDRAFVESLRRVDARIRHAPEVRVTVSGRISGRARGGMADTIRRRITKPDEILDDRLEPAAIAFKRSLLRSYLRIAWDRSEQRQSICRLLSALLELPPAYVSSVFSLPYFGQAWAEMQVRSPTLAKHRVPVAELAGQTEVAQELVELLRLASSENNELGNFEEGEVKPMAERQLTDLSRSFAFCYKNALSTRIRASKTKGIIMRLGAPRSIPVASDRACLHEVRSTRFPSRY